MFTRRTATVTISAPEASCAACMIWWVGYLPVPMMSRDVNSRPAMTNRSVDILPSNLENPENPENLILPAYDEVDDLDLISVRDRGRPVLVAFDDGEVALDGDRARVDC